jgi:hypothetical protein
MSNNYEEEIEKIKKTIKEKQRNQGEIRMILKADLQRPVESIWLSVQENNLFENITYFIKDNNKSLLKSLKIIIKNNFSSYEVPINLLNFADLEPYEFSLPRLLERNKIIIKNLNKYEIEIHVDYLSSIKEFSIIYPFDFHPLKLNSELKNQIKDIFIKVNIKESNNKLENTKLINENNELKEFELQLKTGIEKKKNSPQHEYDKIDNIYLKYLFILKKNNFELSEYFDYFENIILKFYSDKFTFTELGNYLYLYTWDNFKKLKEPKTLEFLKNKFKESTLIDQDYFSKKLDASLESFYSIRKKFLNDGECLKSKLKQIKNEITIKNYTEIDYSVNEIIDNLLNKLFTDYEKSKEPKENSENYPIKNNSDKSSNNITTETQQSIQQTNMNAFIEFISILFLNVKTKTLKEYDLSQNQLLKENAITCMTAIKNTGETMNKLTLSYNKFEDEGCWGLGRALFYNKNITDLDLSVNMLTDDNMASLLIGLNKSPTNLLRLNLSNNYSLTKDSSIHIANLIRVCPNLKYLNLNKNPLGDGFNYISHTLIELYKHNLCALEDLLILQTKLDSDSLKVFSKVLSFPKCKLKTLVLSENNMNNQGGKSIFKAIEKNKSLEEIVMYKCELDNSLEEQILLALRKNSSLVSVNFYDNKLSDPDLLLEILNYGQSTFKSKSTHYLSTEKNSTSGNADIIYSTDLASHISLDNASTMINTQFMDLESPDDLDIATNNKLKNLDFSKNKFKFQVNEIFLDVMQHQSVEMLDICQNYDPSSDPHHLAGQEKLKKIIIDKQDKVKILY